MTIFESLTLAEQAKLRNPDGDIGLAVAEWLNRINRQANARAVELLHLERGAMPGDKSAWSKAKHLARRIHQLTTVPMRSENHPTLDPAWRTAINNGLSAIGTGDEPTMERALNEIDRISRTL